jgi:hypothetical protein
MFYSREIRCRSFSIGDCSLDSPAAAARARDGHALPPRSTSRLSLLKSRRGAVASASAGAKRARSGLRESKGKDSKQGATHEFKAPAPDCG